MHTKANKMKTKVENYHHHLSSDGRPKPVRRSYKHNKHKLKQTPTRLSRRQREDSHCDPQVNTNSSSSSMKSKSKLLWMMIISLLLASTQTQPGLAFCPNKCQCNDQSLSVNCTQVTSLSIVPMTLNPLLKQLTLNHLPLVDLSNSLSLYRQLEYLNLQSNQLRQVRYENFNFKAAPRSMHLSMPNAPSSNLSPAVSLSSQQSATTSLLHEELNAHNEMLARNIKQVIDKSLGGHGGNYQSAAAESPSDVDDVIGFHLRELDLSDNRIDQLGNLVDDPSLGYDGLNEAPTSSIHLKSRHLEQLAPFLTLIKLESLNLAGNRLARLHQHVFLGLVHLKYLDLSRNQLEYIDKHSLVGLIELQALKLGQNKLANHLNQMSLAFCRAPMNELRFLDLSDNHKSQHGEVSLPNQMFICSPRIISLRLDGLQLRYIQVNAFDNLMQLESLNLSRNLLEQVPSDSLTYSVSNVSLSLRHLDLSGTQIEFVNANSFNSLRNLQKLSINNALRLVSFDLASLSYHLQANYDMKSSSLSSQSGSNNIEHLMQSDGNFKSALKSLLPSHLFDRMQTINHANDDNTNANQHRLPRSHGASSEGSSLINDQLIELELKHNPRLQSLHSSLALRGDFPNGPIEFTKLRQLNLQGAMELNELPLDLMINLHNLHHNLRLDLSFANKLNCSSCQMRWLLDLVSSNQQQLAQSGEDFPSTNGRQWSDLFSAFRPEVTGHFELRNGIKLILPRIDTIGCSWPYTLPLTRAAELPQTSNCQPALPEEKSMPRQQAASQGDIPAAIYQTTPFNHSSQDPTRNTSSNQESAGSHKTIAICIIAALSLVLVLAKLLANYVSNSRRRLGKPIFESNQLNWPGCLDDSELASPASSSTASRTTQQNSNNSLINQRDLYCVISSSLGAPGTQRPELVMGASAAHHPAGVVGSIATAASAISCITNKRPVVGYENKQLAPSDLVVGQIERRRATHKRSNLFSRIGARLRGGAWIGRQSGEEGHSDFLSNEILPKSLGAARSDQLLRANGCTLQALQDQKLMLVNSTTPVNHQTTGRGDEATPTARDYFVRGGGGLIGPTVSQLEATRNFIYNQAGLATCIDQHQVQSKWTTNELNNYCQDPNRYGPHQPTTNRMSDGDYTLNGHIYVTLDRPIKQQRSPLLGGSDECTRMDLAPLAIGSSWLDSTCPVGMRANNKFKETSSTPNDRNVAPIGMANSGLAGRHSNVNYGTATMMMDTNSNINRNESSSSSSGAKVAMSSRDCDVTARLSSASRRPPRKSSQNGKLATDCRTSTSHSGDSCSTSDDKYDANHATMQEASKVSAARRQPHADADDEHDDYVINELHNGETRKQCNSSGEEDQTQQLGGASKQTDTATFDGDDDVDDRRLINPMIATGQQHLMMAHCDSSRTRAGHCKPSETNEIYSNQFYYCKPATNTMSHQRR